MTDQATGLTCDVYVTPAEPTVSGDLPPGETQRPWSPPSAALISGKRDGVLAGPLLAAGQARGLADWVAAPGKNLTAVYVTHGHGDHWFGLSVILDRFPGARAVARPVIIEQMRQGSTPEVLVSFRNTRFPGQIPAQLAPAGPLPDHAIGLEGHELGAVDLGPGGTDATTCLHVPAADLIIADARAYLTAARADDLNRYLVTAFPSHGGSTMQPLQNYFLYPGHR